MVNIIVHGVQVDGEHHSHHSDGDITPILRRDMQSFDSPWSG